MIEGDPKKDRFVVVWAANDQRLIEQLNLYSHEWLVRFRVVSILATAGGGLRAFLEIEENG